VAGYNGKQIETRMSNYVEIRDGGYYVAGSRVSLDSIVYEFREGASPESIQQNFPTLTLEQIYGAIAFYLGHQSAVDAYLIEGEKLWDKERRKQAALPTDLKERIDRARRELHAKRT
jgi:uncharacterized protein (DUF433 family)